MSAALFADLFKLTGHKAIVEFDEDAGQFGVWCVDESGGFVDMVGAGDSETEALEDAIRTAQVWKQNEGRPGGVRSRFE